MRYLQAGLLKDVGIQHFDEWAADFGQVTTDFELKPESDCQYQLKTRFAKFMNLPELMSMFKECADIRTADTLNLPRPESETIDVVAEPSKIRDMNTSEPIFVSKDKRIYNSTLNDMLAILCERF